MELDEACIHGGKEVAPDERQQRKGGHDEEEEADRHGAAVMERRGEQAAVIHAQALEAALEGGDQTRAKPGGRRGALVRVTLCLAGHEVVHHRRHQGPREEVRGQHREDDRHGQRDEEELGGSADEHHRNEDDADAERGDEGGRGDLAGAIEDGPNDGFLLRHVPVDVLDLHRRVVHEDPDRQRHSAQGHHVQRLAQPGEDDDGDQDRERDGDDDDQRAAPTPEEDEEHQRGQPCGDHRLLDDALDRSAHEDRLIEEERDL